MKRVIFFFLISFFLLSSVACGISWKPNAVDDVNTTLSEYPEAYILSNNIIEVDIFKASAGYNRYYTPSTNEVLIQNERVYVERKVGAAWVPDGAVQSVKIVETDTGYNAIRSYDGVHTFYDVVYVLDDGKPLKFEVNLTAKSEGEYRIHWDIQGIMGDNQFVDGGSYIFGESEYNYKVQIDISDVIEGFGEEYIDVQSSTSVPTGRILDFYFGSFNLGIGENVLVDPLISGTSSSYGFMLHMDLDDDGDIDFLVDPLKWVENNGAESFNVNVIDALTPINYGEVVDLDEDGDKDIVGSTSDGVYHVDGDIFWYDNNGAESFTKKIINTSISHSDIHDFNVIDLDDDGDNDIIIATNSDDTILFLQNDGNENFNITTLLSYPDVNNPRSVKLYDLDEDGDVDIITASYSSDEISWHENDGNETFTTHVLTTSANGAEFVDVVDLDEDGDNDIISASQLDSTLRWFENNGAESFAVHSLGSGTAAYDVGYGDIDGDGDIDLVSGDNNPTWFENNGAESFTSHIIYDTPYTFSRVVAIGIVDVDDDGDLDVYSSISSDGLRWYKHADMDVRTLDLSDVALILVVRNGDNIGGFVDVNGYMYFNELEYTSSLYTVSITGSDQDSGMKVKTNTDIGSVSSIKVQFKTLDSAKSYDIYLDDVYKETAYRSGTHDYTYTESGLQTVKLQETKENIQMSLTNLTSSAINASGVTVADAASQNLVSGAATFEPYKYENGIYPINIANSSLADGFNFTLTASGLTAAPTTFNGLDSSKYYHVNYDSSLHENINGVTSYTYNFTSFSTHTVQLVEYTPTPTGEDEEAPPSAASGFIDVGEITITKDEFDLLTIEQIEAMNVSQDVKDKLIAIKSINVNWWMFILGLCIVGVITEGGRKEGNEVVLLIAITGVIISAYKLGYF